MDHPHAKNPSKFSKRKTSSIPSKSKPPFSNDTTVIWSNLAFMADDQPRVESNVVLDSMTGKNKKREFFKLPITDEELKLRDELAKEIEKELERELMEGIVVLVHRLTDLKAKQAIQSCFKIFNLDYNHQQDCYLRENSSVRNQGNVSVYRKGDTKDGKGSVHVGIRNSSQRMPANFARPSHGNCVREQLSECSDAESSTCNLSHRRKELGRRRVERCLYV